MGTQKSQNKTALIQSMNHECKKQHYVYTGSVPTALYEAPVDTPDQGACLVTYFTYSGTNVTGSVEFIGVWSSAWDIAYP